MTSHRYICGVLLALTLSGCGAHSGVPSLFGGPGQPNAVGDSVSPNISVTFTEYNLPGTNSHPNGITRGPDGNIWFTEILGNKIGRITTGGSITEFPIPTANSFPLDITEGSDGNLWFTESLSNNIGRITPQGTISEFSIPAVVSDLSRCEGIFVENATAIYGPVYITLGSDGNVWFTDCVTNSIGKISQSGHISNFPLTKTGDVPIGITTGSDGDLYFTEWRSRLHAAQDAVGKMTISGSLIFEISTPTLSPAVGNIASEPGGDLRFVEIGANQIGDITTAGAISEAPIPFSGGAPNGIAFGSDGAIWLTFQSTVQPAIIRLRNSNVFSEFPIPFTSRRMRKIGNGPDANLWFTNTDDNAIGVAHPSSGIGRWRTLAPMPTARSGPAIGVINGKLYVVGGFGGTTFLSTNEAYDPATNGWSTMASMPTAREVEGANAPIFDGKMYILGGNASGICSKKVEAYDPTTNSWATKAPMPTARCHFVTLIENNLIYAIGGTNTSGRVFASVDVYNPATNTWSAGIPMPTARAFMTASSTANDVIVYEGSTSTGGLDTTVEDFNTVTNQWTLRPWVPTLRTGSGAASGIKNRIYAIGGSYTGNRSSVVDAFDTSKNYWFPRASMPTARTEPGVGFVSGNVFVIGGSTSSTVSNANEEFIDQ